MRIELLNPIAAILIRAGPMIWTCEWPPTENAPLESVLNYRMMMSQSHGSQKRRRWTGLCMTRCYRRLGGIPKGVFLARAGLRKLFDICGKFSYSSGKFWFPHDMIYYVCNWKILELCKNMYYASNKNTRQLYSIYLCWI